MNMELVTTFAEKQSHYTGANNKRKWVITNPKYLKTLLRKCEKKPAKLAKLLDTSYATVKRWLVLADLWDMADVKKRAWKGGRKRSATVDKFGYIYADKVHDIITETGEVKRRFQHHVMAEAKMRRPLSDGEVVHHIDLDKSNNDPENLVVCADNKYHRELYGQLERIAGELVRRGVISFNHIKEEYFIKE